MSKNKPKETIEYVIRFQDKERQMVDSAIGAYQVNRILTPIITLMNDISGMTVFLTIVASLGLAGVQFIFNATGTDDMHVLLTDFFIQRDQAAAAAGVTILARGPIWGFVDILERTFNFNLPDFEGGFEPQGNGGGGGGGF